MTKELVRFAPAKINLYLEVKARRPDGYHDIESVMQTVSLFDKITFSRLEPIGERRITLTCTDPAIPCDSRNLVFRAAELLFNRAGVENYNVAIHLEKHIPSAAGLGGGSSDAATTLLALTDLYLLDVDMRELCRLGVKLGADIPFCLIGGTAVTRGIGDILEPCPPMPDCFVVIACAGEGVSTPWAYRRLDEMYDFSRRSTDVDTYTKVLEQGNIKKVVAGMTNIFEDVVLPERETARLIRDIMNGAGALRAMMSGSGPSVMGIFTDSEMAESAKLKLSEKGFPAHICKPYYPEFE